MNIQSVEIFQYNLPFVRPVFISQKILDFREGLIVLVTIDDGSVGIGEIAPLPGLSRELLRKALFDTKECARKCVGQKFPEDIKALDLFCRQLFVQDTSFSVRFGLEAALVHALALSQKVLTGDLLRLTPVQDFVRTTGLLQGSVDEIKVQVQNLKNQGYQHFKLKVGGKNIPLDVAKVQAVREHLGKEGLLRLDANRGWSLEEALAFAKSVGPESVEFIEEPVKDNQQLEEFVRMSRWPVALDESLDFEQKDPVIFPECAAYIVLKPTIIGGFFKALNNMIQAQTQGKSVVISSAFESSIGMTALAGLSFFTPCAAGFGTLAWFKDDLRNSSLINAQGAITREALRFDRYGVHYQLLNHMTG